MTTRQHHYRVETEWLGNTGRGTSDYRAYERAHSITAAGKPTIPGSSDPSFRGDPTRWNPEELLVASLAACHQLWYLALCAGAGIVVTAYADRAEGVMAESADGGGQFERVILRPEVTLANGQDRDRAMALHDEAHEKCFIARSVNFPVVHEATVRID